MGYTPDELLRSTDQVDVAMGLANMLAEGQPDLAMKIRALGQVVWQTYIPKPGEKYKDAQKKKTDAANAVKAIFDDSKTAEEKKKLAEAYARLGHLYEIAGHVARENFFLEREEKCKNALAKGDVPTRDELAPGGLHEMLFNKTAFTGKKVDEIIDLLNEPVTEYVFTQHPTNTNTLESMQLQRQIAKEAEEVVAGKAGSLEALKASIKKFGEVPLVQEKNFTAKDETDIVLNFLANSYHDIDRLYEVSDRALARKFGEEYSDEKRAELDLKVRFGSWGSAGDKDGNNNIKSENTLEAIIMHKQKAAELLAASLAEVKDVSPELLAWQAQAQRAANEYSQLVKVIEKFRGDGNDIPLTNDQFTDIANQTHDIGKLLEGQGGKDGLETALGKAFAASTDKPTKDKLLAIDRKVRVFGLNLGKIEYRETAEEYARVVNLFMNTDKAKNAFGVDKQGRSFAEIFVESNDEKQRAEILKDILQDEAKRKVWVEIAQEFMKNHDGASEKVRTYAARNDKQQDYTKSEKGDEAIIYRTLRRMELARDFDDMITHNVLAEANGVDSMMEALALQYAVTNGDGKRAKLNIVPLFEEAETMEKIPDVLKDSLENGAYKAHMKELQDKDKTTKITQQIRIAHSDNARRAGAIASRGIIHEGHVAARRAIDEYNAEHPDAPVELQFFEGGSLSDSYRNGVRAHTAMIEDFGLSKFGKFTFQGGDLLNYFNQPTSMERVLLRGIVKQVEMGQNGHKVAISPQEEKIQEALSNLQKDYEHKFYDTHGYLIEKFLREIDYYDHIAAGNAGTRGPGRTNDNNRDKPVDSKKIRTIGFSETFQHEGIHPTFLGAGDIAASIEKRLAGGIGANHLSAAQWQEMYQTSAAFGDVVDKLAYSIINSDLKAFGETFNHKMTNIMKEATKAYKNAFTDQERAQALQHQSEAEEILKFANVTIPQDYIAAGKLVYEALTGKPFIDPKTPDSIQHKIVADALHVARQNDNILDAADRMKHLITNLESMQHLEPLNYKRRFVGGLQVVETSIKQAVGSTVGYLARLFHNAIDTFTHGRTFMADDPTYRAAYMHDKGRDQSLAV